MAALGICSLAFQAPPMLRTSLVPISERITTWLCRGSRSMFDCKSLTDWTLGTTVPINHSETHGSRSYRLPADAGHAGGHLAEKMDIAS